jgi:hypothetical protein
LPRYRLADWQVSYSSERKLGLRAITLVHVVTGRQSTDDPCKQADPGTDGGASTPSRGGTRCRAQSCAA